jgi:photosystem II stability/assembly factor-like uncharacterized protein
MKLINGGFVKYAIVLLTTCAFLNSLHAQNSWQPTNGPYGGRIGALATTSNGTLLAGSGSSAYRSTNNGERWEKVSDLPGLGYLGVSSFSHSQTGRTFVAAGGAFRSTDNGQTWMPINQGLVGGVSEIAAGTGDRVFACSQYMFRSTNNGDSWMQLNVGFPQLNGCFSLAASQTGLVLAGIVAGTTANGLIRSTDNGNTWGLVLNVPYVRAIAFNAMGHIFIGTDYSGALRSTDNGSTWIAVNTGLPSPPQRGVAAIAVDGSGALFAGTPRGVFRSTNNGENWVASSSGLGQKYIGSLTLDSVGTLFAGTLTGVFRSTNSGASWQPVNDGITDYAVTVLAKNSSGHIFAGSSEGWGFFRSTNEGNSWEDMSSDGARLGMSSLAISASQHLFAGSQAGVSRSTDNGGSWVSVGPTSFVSCLAINASGNIFAGVYDYWFDLGAVFRSTNDGTSWTRVDSAMAAVFTLVVTGSGHILTGTRTGVYRSTNNGDTWIHFGSSPANVRMLALNNAGHLFAGTYASGMFRSIDGGQNWTAINFGLPSTYIKALAVDARGEIFVGLGTSWPFRGEGVFHSTDNGTTWTSINEGFGDLNVISLLVAPSGRVYAGTLVEGVFSRSGTTTVRLGDEELPGGFALEQNYPNPFNPSTKIKFQIPSSKLRFGISDLGFVSLKVYDILGREVRTLVNDNLPPGSYEVTFDAGGLASGVYLYRLRAGEFTQTKRMLLMR